MRTYRILHIFGKMDRGGAEMRTLELMEKLSNEKQFLFDFCVLSGQPGELDSKIRSLGGEVHYLKLNFAFTNQFRRLLRTKKYDAIHSHVHLFSGYLLKLAA
ncbi:MAG: glycosyltransferase family 1 protein, partial [Pseudobdellovibrionaceae bacterium]